MRIIIPRQSGLAIRLGILVCSWVGMAGCQDTGNRLDPGGSAIYYNGPIITMRADAPIPEALLVRNGRVAAMGSRDEIFARRNDETELVDLAGQTLAPGFIAVHTHPDLAAFFHSFVDLSGFRHDTPDQVWAQFDAAVAAARPGEWLLCKGFDPMLVPGLQAPTLADLDRRAPNNPVFIIAQNLHAGWANSAAFAELEITADTPDPEAGSYYETDENGELTGYIVEIGAIRPFTRNALQQLDIPNNARGVLREYAAQGITTVATPGMFTKDSKPLMLFEHLSTGSPKLLTRALAWLGFLPKREASVRHFAYLQPESDHLLPASRENGDDFFRVLGIKLWYDGSPYVGSMLLEDPYIDSPLMQQGLGVPRGTRGKAKFARREFRELVRKYHTAGWQLAVHAQGDRATREVLAAFAGVLGETPAPSGGDPRHRLEHGLLTPGDSLASIRELGLSPSLHINHLYYYGEALRDSIIGARRAEIMLPLSSIAASGGPFSIHADLPMYPEVPLSLLATAVNRKTRGGVVLGGDERIDTLSGLRALTTHAAWQLHMENRIGSLAPGMYADFVILNENPLTTDPAKLREIKVTATCVHGQRIYSAQ